MHLSFLFCSSGGLQPHRAWGRLIWGLLSEDHPPATLQVTCIAAVEQGHLLSLS